MNRLQSHNPSLVLHINYTNLYSKKNYIVCQCLELVYTLTYDRHLLVPTFYRYLQLETSNSYFKLLVLRLLLMLLLLLLFDSTYYLSKNYPNCTFVLRNFRMSQQSYSSIQQNRCLWYDQQVLAWQVDLQLFRESDFRRCLELQVKEFRKVYQSEKITVTFD